MALFNFRNLVYSLGAEEAPGSRFCSQQVMADNRSLVLHGTGRKKSLISSPPPRHTQCDITHFICEQQQHINRPVWEFPKWKAKCRSNITTVVQTVISLNNVKLIVLKYYTDVKYFQPSLSYFIMETQWPHHLQLCSGWTTRTVTIFRKVSTITILRQLKIPITFMPSSAPHTSKQNSRNKKKLLSGENFGVAKLEKSFSPRQRGEKTKSLR